MTIQTLENNLTNINIELEELEKRKEQLLKQREELENQMEEYSNFQDELEELIERYPNISKEFIVEKINEIKDNNNTPNIPNIPISNEEYENIIQDIIKEHKGDLCAATDKLIDLGKNHKEKFTTNQLEDLRAACSLCDTRKLITRDKAIKQADNLNYGSEHFDSCLSQLKSLLNEVKDQDGLETLEEDYLWLAWFTNRKQWGQVINIFKETENRLIKNEINEQTKS